MNALLHYGKEFGKEVTEINAEARALLERYHYPGNIRELQNIIERATIFCTGRTLTASSLPRELRDQTKQQTTTTVTHGDGQVIRVEMQVGKHTLAEIEDSIIEEALRLSDYNKSLAAKQLGLTRFALDRRLKKIHRDD
jgi:two-component system response regulator AtoC